MRPVAVFPWGGEVFREMDRDTDGCADLGGSDKWTCHLRPRGRPLSLQAGDGE